MKTLKTSFIKRMKVLGALVRPKGITNHSYNPIFFKKSCFRFISKFHSNLVVATSQVNLCENYRTTQIIKHIIKPRNRMMVSNGNVIDGSTINTHTASTIFLWNQKHRNNTRTKALMYIPAVQKFLDLSLNFLSLIGVGSVGCSVGQSCSRNQVDLMLYPSHRWQPLWYLSWKNIRVLLQNVSDSRRYRASNIIK